MTGRLKPYPSYKDSGVEWLGRIPTHWATRKLKYVASLRSGEAITSEEITESGDYPVFGGNGLRGYTSRFNRRGNYVLIGRQGALCGNINYAKGEFWASEHAIVATILGECNFIWLGELLRALNLNQYSQSAAQPGLAAIQISNLPIPVPPVCEQSQIANLLARESAKVDALVKKKERLIELLQEKRTALISHAVTQGLNPNAPKKDSGIPWLGWIPEHWDVKRLKHLALQESDTGIQIGPFGGMLTEVIYGDEGSFKVYGQENTLSGDFSKGQRWLTNDQFAVLSKYRIAPEDVLFTRKGSIGGCSMVPVNAEQGIIDSDTIRLRVNKAVLNTSFVLYAFKFSAFLQAQVQEIKRGAILSGLNTSTIANLLFIVPPVAEQTAITDYLDRETTKLDALLAKVRAAVDRLQEYRTALISAAVTGQIDVRDGNL